MAVVSAREQSFVRALMYLGPKPRRPKPIQQVHDEYVFPQEEVDAYQRSTQYAEDVQMYFMKHVFQGMTSALGDTDTWIEDFYAWQDKENASCM